MLKQTFVALGVATLVVLSTPMTAFAAVPAAIPAATTAGPCTGVLDTDYANSRLVSVSSPVVAPGGTVLVTWSPDFFEPGSLVTINAGGNGGAQPVISTASGSGVGSVVSNASSDGGVVVSVAVPSDASGRIDIAGMSDAACGGVSVSVVPNAQLATLALDGKSASTDGILASTGGSLPTILLLSGSAAVVFGAILFGARTRARRSLQQ